MAKAKTASKNNPVARDKAKDIFFNGKKVKPVLYIGEKRKYMAVQYEDGTLAFDTEGSPVPWSKIKK